jgi:cytoskeletal protein CcmA (bactofilin family)
VSEAGFVMEEETLRLIIRNLNELKTELKTDLNNQKTDMNDVNMDINTVYDGQEELKGQLKGDVSALKTNINDVKTDVKMDIRAVAIGQDDL